eukprot:791178-Prymnesium_polylepis.2
MGPVDVITVVMEAMKKGDFKTLLGFALKDDGAYEDTLGQLAVGAFGAPEREDRRASNLARTGAWRDGGAGT